LFESPHPLCILIVDDQESVRGSLAAELDAAGHRVLEAPSGEWALTLFERHRPDLVLLDVEMPLHDGYWAARQMRAAEPGGWTPIIFLSAHAEDQDLWRGIEAGGDDYLTKPVSPVVLRAKLQAMQRLRRMRQRLVQMSDDLRIANQQLEMLSQSDPLTGLLNRRAFDTRLQHEIDVARRDGKPLTLVLCDVDHFKRYNDSAGHLAGDECLRQLAGLMRRICRRPRDCAARYGGEEFALILPDTPRSGAMTFARAARRMLQALALPHPDRELAPYVTVSGGITTCQPDADTSAEGLLMRADEALYTAKARGRNRFFSFEMQMDTSTSRTPSALTPAAAAPSTRPVLPAAAPAAHRRRTRAPRPFGA